MNVIASAFVLFPYMFQVATGNECEVVVAYYLAVVAYYTTGTSSIFNEVQLHGVMAVNGVIKLPLVTGAPNSPPLVLIFVIFVMSFSI